MRQLTFAEVEDELYSLTPAEFIGVRDERAREARAAGQRDVAAAVKKLGRPTVGAWLVNQLSRSASEQMSRLYEVGAALQEAQRTLAGDRLRELSADRRRAIADLMPEASRLAAQARQAASAAVLGEVKATLEAAVADAEARDAVRAGRLTKALVYAGLGEVDLSAALAAAPQPGQAPQGSAADVTDRGAKGAGRRAAPAESATDADNDRAAESEVGRVGRADSERAVRAAERKANAASAALEKAEREVSSLAEQRQFLRRRLDHLGRELAKARADDEHLDRQARLARDRADQARVTADAAAAALDEAQNGTR